MGTNRNEKLDEIIDRLNELLQIKKTRSREVKTHPDGEKTITVKTSDYIAPVAAITKLLEAIDKLQNTKTEAQIREEVIAELRKEQETYTWRDLIEKSRKLV